MKQLMKRLCVLMMIVSLCLTYSSIAAASSNKKTELWVYSSECPEEAVEYAENNFMRYVLSSIESGAFSIEEVVTLGFPFTIEGLPTDSPLYYFPVISGGEIVATFRVFLNTQQSDQTYTGIMSEELVEEINFALELYTSKSQPASFHMADDNLVIKKGGAIYCPYTGVEMTEVITDARGINSQNQICITTPMSTLDVSAVALPATSPSRYLNLSLCERQIDDYWCAAYSAAAIIRYCTSNTTYPKAIDLMSLLYTNPSTETPMTNDQVVYVASRFALYPVYVRSYITNAYDQIDNGCPVYLHMERDVGTDAHATHAIVLRGYNSTFGTFSIWNPWNSNYETMDAVTYTYSCTKGTYTWERTIYGWPAP